MSNFGQVKFLLLAIVNLLNVIIIVIVYFEKKNLLRKFRFCESFGHNLIFARSSHF